MRKEERQRRLDDLCKVTPSVPQTDLGGRGCDGHECVQGPARCFTHAVKTRRTDHGHILRPPDSWVWDPNLRAYGFRGPLESVSSYSVPAFRHST